MSRAISLLFSSIRKNPPNPNPNSPSSSSFLSLLSNPIPNPNRHSRPPPSPPGPNSARRLPTFTQNPNLYPLRNPNPNPNIINRLFSTSRNSMASDKLIEIVDLIRRNEASMESNLDRKNPRLSGAEIADIFQSLNQNSISSLRFLNWVLNSLHFNPNSEIYNLVIDNLGRVDDYKTMFLMLEDLSSKKHCLTERAFAFLTIRSSSALDDSVTYVVEALSRVSGSCRGSGVHSLIRVLCGMNCFDLAIFVMEETTRRTSYYNVLIAGKCRNGDFVGARGVLDEMRMLGCNPNVNSYNYLLGSLFKSQRAVEACDLMQSMEEMGYFPDPVTYEIISFHACRTGRMDLAMEFLDRMFCEGMMPRLTTHAAFIKGYFRSGRVGDACRYVTEISSRDKYSANMNYSLLARLFWGSRRVVEAGRVLHEMMEKGLRPNYPVYMKVTKDLNKMMRGDLASQLITLFWKFDSISETA